MTRQILRWLVVAALGTNCATHGLAAVTTTGSIYDDGSNYRVGYTANGTLTINAGSWLSRTTGYVGYNSGCNGTATVTGTGSKWANNGYLYVGYSGIGTLNIGAGGYVTHNAGYLGYNAGSTGTATVTGAGSRWIGNLAVGYSGSGTLNVEAGGYVGSYYGYLGYYAGSTGTATVTGAGSTWGNTGELYVGYSGSGTLMVADGGWVTAGTLYASSSDLFGNGTITVGGAVLDADMPFDSAHGPTPTLPFGSGGALKLSPFGSGALGAGWKGVGTLRIADGLSVQSAAGYLAYNSGSTGSAMVTGANSTWSTGPYNLYVGNSGSGTLSIDNRGRVGSYDGYIGYNSGSTGTATVSGTGSTWANTSRLYVGYYGSGKLAVADGGLVSAKTIYASSNDLSGNGTITAKGAVLDANLVFDATHGLTQAIPFGSGGALNLTLDGTGDLGAGYRGTGTLQIADGLTPVSSTGYVGFMPGADGAATVTGAGSKWTTNGSLYVGNSGTGTLNIAGGGQVTGGTAYLGFNSGSTGTATVTTTGSNWTNAAELHVGEHGNGTLVIEAGGQVTSGSSLYGYRSYLGYYAGSSGTVKVSGAGSKWINNYKLFIGNSGSGTLNIDAGGQVSNAVVGALGGASGAATVTGAGSKWTNSGDLYVGLGGPGTLSIRGGGLVSNSLGYLGYSTGFTGTVTLADNGSTWTNSSTLYIGYAAGGTLNIQAGGQVTDSTGYLGYNSGSTGAATVTGAGSTWTSSSSLYVGNSGSGKLTVADGGKVTGKTGIVNNSQSTIRLHVSGNDMLVLGNATTAGSLTNKGAINFYADALLPAGVYTPISEYAGRAMTWSGTGAYNAWGGTWDNVNKQFLVSSVTVLMAGSSENVSTAERLLFTDPASGKRVGASFGTVAGGTNFAADLMTPSEINALMATPGFSGSVLSGWDFTTNFTGGQALLSFDIGLGKQDLKVWHLQGATWTPYTPDLQTYDSHGILSFTANQFSGYAVAGVPEPSTFALLGVAAVLLVLSRRRRRA